MTTIERTTPQASLELMTHILPLDLHIKEMTIKAYTRLKNQLDTPRKPTKSFILPHLAYCSNNADYLDTNDDRCEYLEWERRLCICKESFKADPKIWQKSEFTVYTDGSKINDKVGSGYVIFKGNKVIQYANERLSDHATVFQEEIHTLTQAARYILSSNIKIKYLKFFSDSQAAIQAIDKALVTSTMVRDAVCTLEEVTNKIPSTKLLWIKAHAGHEGNEIADSQAKLQNQNRGD